MGWSNFLFSWFRSFKRRLRAYKTEFSNSRRVELDTNGRFIILRLKTPGETSFNVVNIYAPTDCREQIDFIESFTKKIISLTDSSNLIIAGDWNTTLNSIDKHEGLPWKETKYRNLLVY